ncbi:MAG: tetratricopeptide repeat protein [Clostridia bacterium]|nr:tetratricopeptide repeat protein [Clostridia bacterium]
MGATILQWKNGRERLRSMAENYYADGNYIAALRFLYKEFQEYGGDFEGYLRMADAYENLGLNAYALKWLFQALDIAEEEDLPDLYEGIAVNFLSLGEEAASAYYYNLLIGVDDTLTKENKMEIAAAFSKNKKDAFRFVWPPELADFSPELDAGAQELKDGNTRNAIEQFSKVEKGSREYLDARQMMAVSHLLEGETSEAEKLCLEALEIDPYHIQTRSTLAAVYLEQGRPEESLALAKELTQLKVDKTDDLYKIATVCCENGLHAEAYERFTELEKKMPYDGKMLYFKGISAYKSGKLTQAEATFTKLCDLYPDAEVVKYYLRRVRRELAGEEKEEGEVGYFYRVTKEEREARCRSLLSLNGLPKEARELLAECEEVQENLEWCFDEMDGMDKELQYFAVLVAEQLRLDGFLREKLLDQEIADALKIEILRLFALRNEDKRVGLVLCNVYRPIRLYRVKLGKKKRKAFLTAYAQLAAKLSILSPAHGAKLKLAAEKVYDKLAAGEYLDEVSNKEEDLAAAIYLFSGLKELGRRLEEIVSAFDADEEAVYKIFRCVNSVTEEEKK